MAYKLLIFDLDDTLIDTFNYLSPIKLREAFKAMLKAGLKTASEKEAWELLQNINLKSISVKQTFQNFLKDNNSPEHQNLVNSTVETNKLLEIALNEYYKKIPEDCCLNTTPDALEVIKELQKKYKLAIVSKGEEELQYKKIKKSGIQQSWFKKIIIVSEEKKTAYQSLLQENKYPNSEILVCGDKYELDLLPAKELGLVTVHFLWGRAKNDPQKYNTDYIITDLKDILKIVKLKE